MNAKHRIFVMIRGLFWTLLFIAIVACGIRLSPNKGKIVPEANRILLKDGGPHESVWKTKHLSVAYSYTNNRETLFLHCDVDLNKRVFGGMDVIDHLFFSVNFIDANGKITKTKVIWNPGFSEVVRKQSFKSELDIPPDTRGMVFSYMGRARETQGGSIDSGVVTFDFWKNPLDPPPPSKFFR
jgi:hypothetical protein